MQAFASQQKALASQVIKRLVFVSSCLNEQGNIRELYERCRAAYECINREGVGVRDIDFAMVIADNCSTDATLSVLERIAGEDPRVLVLANAANYGPEASLVNALSHVDQDDLVMLLSSDLQDPPELAHPLLGLLLESRGCDGALAVKRRSSGSLLLRLCRRLYYFALGYSTRLRLVPSGFHGCGLYRQHALVEAVALWKATGWSLRLCLVNGCQSTCLIGYDQAQRRWGKTSYQGSAYLKEALLALLSADSAGSRLAFLLGSAALLTAFGVGFFLLVNWLGGQSGYERGVPTVMALVLGSFAVQMLMIALLSRQVEELRMAGRLRPHVRYRLIARQGLEG